MEPRALEPRVLRPRALSVDASGMTFGALAWGDTEAPLALLVHGYPDTAWTWRHLGPVLAQRGWHAVAPFTRGYAPTDLAPDDSYLIADQVSDIIRLEAALQGSGPSVLIGHDWGAVATWSVTQHHPTTFARYVALSVPPTATVIRAFASPRSLRLGLRQARMSWYFLYNQLPGAERGLDRVIPRLWRDWSPGYDAREDLRHVWEALEGPGRRRAVLRYYRDNLQQGLAQTVSISPGAPALALHGERDGCMHPALAAVQRATLVAGSRFTIVSGAGHFVQLEQPDQVNALITGWLAESSAADR